MGDWRHTTWGDEVSLEYGKGLRGYADAEGPFRVFGTNGPVGWTSEPLAPGPGVILGRKGAYRGVRYSPDPFFVIDTAYYVVPKTDLHMRWLYYSIIYHKLGEIDDGSPIPSTTRSAVYVRELEVPPPSEQRGIASVLGTLDDKIDLNRKVNKTLNTMARALFKSWFVDFDPVRAKMEGRQPAHMDADTAALFPDAFDAEGKPQAWDRATTFAVAEVLSGGTPKTSVDEYWNGMILWASAKDVSQSPDTFLISTERTITQAGLNNSSTKVIPARSTVVVARGATTGRHCMFGDDIAMNQTCYGLYSKDNCPFFLFSWFGDLVDRMVHSAHGSVFDTITTKTFQTTQAIVPPLTLRKEFEKLVSPMFECVLTNIR